MENKILYVVPMGDLLICTEEETDSTIAKVDIDEATADQIIAIQSSYFSVQAFLADMLNSGMFLDEHEHGNGHGNHEHGEESHTHDEN